jgi:putative SbcD/Mre11-related phosphoesterase
MDILAGIRIIDLALYISKHKTLVISDLHIGFEEALNKEGFLIPRFHFKDLVLRLENILKQVNPETIVIAGDLKHEFGKISETEWKNTLKIIDFLSRHCSQIVLVRGNHDRILEPILEKRKSSKIMIADQLVIGDIVIAHGNKLVKETKGIKTIIIGHEHPAVGISEMARTETFKCFLKGKFEGKNLVVMPSMNLVTEGTDVSKEKLMSPYLKKRIGNFECYVVADKVYYFGKLKDIPEE